MGHPLFITHHGIVTAVLVSREHYRSWCPDVNPAHPRRPAWGRATTGASAAARCALRVVRAARRRVWTQHGWLDFGLAQVLVEQGVETELIWTEKGWWTDDEG